MADNAQASGSISVQPVADTQSVVLSGVESRPRLADRVQLRGPLQDSGFQDGAGLAERDGRFLQLSGLLYLLAEQCDGSRTLDQIAASLTAQLPWQVGAQHVDHLLSQKLVPLGLVQFGREDGGHPGRASGQTGADVQEPRTGDATATPSPGQQHLGGVLESPLRLTARRRLLGPRAIELVSRRLRVLFVPPVAVAVLATVLASRVWLYGIHGPAASIQQVFHRPVLFLLVVGTFLLAAVFHEFGHSSALRYGGGRARGMGVGFYAIFPAFYTDVTDGYRLSRWQRVRTDVGGPYFHLVFSLFALSAYAVTRQEFLLLIVVLIDLEAARQFLPFKRLDGYWLLADLVGLPDLTTLIRPLLRSMPRVGERITGDRLPPLRGAARRVLIIYSAGITVALPAALLIMIYFVPYLAGQAWDSLVIQAHQLPAAIRGTNIVGNRILDVAAVLLALLLLTVQMAGLWMFIALIVVRPMVRALRWSRHQPPPTRRLIRHGLAGLLGAFAMAYGAAWPWAQVSGGGAGSSGVPGMTLDVGKAALAGGVGLVAVTPMMLLASSWRRRAVCGLAAVLLGLAGVAAGAWALTHTPQILHHDVAQRMAQLTGHTPSPARVNTVAHRLADIGVHATPTYGAALETAGGIATVAVATFAVVAATRRRSLAAEHSAGTSQPPR